MWGADCTPLSCTVGTRQKCMAPQREFVPVFSLKKVVFFHLGKDYSVLWPGHPSCSGDRNHTLFLAGVPRQEGQSVLHTLLWQHTNVELVKKHFTALRVVCGGSTGEFGGWRSQEFVLLLSQAGAALPVPAPLPALQTQLLRDTPVCSQDTESQKYCITIGEITAGGECLLPCGLLCAY